MRGPAGTAKDRGRAEDPRIDPPRTPGVETLLALRDELATRFLAAGSDETSFAELAEDVLVTSDLPERITPAELVTWLAGSSEVPPVVAPGPDFESFIRTPPAMSGAGGITVEVRFRSAYTSPIHDHEHDGALLVLRGSAVLARYTFEERSPPQHGVALGMLALREVERLEVGHVERIIRGPAGVHALGALEKPTVLLVARRRDPTAAWRRNTYRLPSVELDPELARTLERLAPELEALAIEELATLPPSAMAPAILGSHAGSAPFPALAEEQRACPDLQPTTFELGLLSDDAALQHHALAQLRARARAAFGDGLETFERVLEEDRRAEILRTLYRSAISPDYRLAIAGLLYTRGASATAPRLPSTRRRALPFDALATPVEGSSFEDTIPADPPAHVVDAAQAARSPLRLPVALGA